MIRHAAFALLIGLTAAHASGAEAAGHDHDHAAPVATAATGVPAVVLSPEAIQRHGVIVAPVAQSNALRQPIIAPAAVIYDPDRVAHIGTVAAGRIAKLHVGEGAVVAAGEALIDIDSPELGQAQNEFLRKRAALAVAQAATTSAQQTHERAKALLAQQALPAAEAQRREADFARARTELLVAEADLQAADNALILLGLDDAARSELARSGKVSPRLTVRAPLAGMVIERHATLGQVVGPSTERLMTIADPAALWVVVDVPEAQAGAITVGATAIITGPLLGERALTTTVAAISPAVDARTRAVHVRLVVAGGSGLRPGAFVQVEIRPAATRTSAVVPRSAVFTIDGSPTIFVPNGAPNRFIAQTVAIGAAVGDLVPVLDGLKIGDLAVVAGGFVIKADLGKAGAKGCCDLD